MGVIKKQGIKTSAVIYIGAMLGYLNAMVLFPKFLGKENYGLLQTLFSASFILAQFARVGIPNLTIRYFPKFRNDENGHNGFFPFISIVGLLGGLVFIGVYFLIEDWFVSLYASNSPLFVTYSYLLIPLTLGFVFIEIYSAYSRSVLKAFVPSLIREIVIRLIITFGILLFAMQFIKLTGFLSVVVSTYWIAVLILIIYFKYLKQLHLKSKWNFIKKSFAKEMTNYSVFAFLGGSAAMLVNRIDVLMISSMLNLANTGVYAVAVSISTILYIPTRALSQITDPVISRAWKENDLQEIKHVYQQTSLLQFIAGVFAFLGVWCNIDNIFEIALPDYAEGKYVILFIGGAKLFDMITGCNSAIISNSKYYRFILYSNACLVFIAILSNYLLIPHYGIVGAAIATALSVFLFNLAKMVFIYSKIKLHPFSINTLKILGIAGGVYILTTLIPTIENIWIDVLSRSVFITIIFGSLTYFMNISDQINGIIQNVLKKVGVTLK